MSHYENKGFSPQRQKYDNSTDNAMAFHGVAPFTSSSTPMQVSWDALRAFPAEVDSEAPTIKWQYFFIVGH